MPKTKLYSSFTSSVARDKELNLSLPQFLHQLMVLPPRSTVMGGASKKGLGAGSGIQEGSRWLTTALAYRRTPRALPQY